MNDATSAPEKGSMNVSGDVVGGGVPCPARGNGIYNLLVGDWLNFQLMLCILIIMCTGLYARYVASDYEIQILVYTVVFAAMGVGWSIASGFAGQLLIGYISFFGVGAYINAILLTKFGVSPWINFALAGAGGGLLAMLAAAICVRFGLNEDYFGLFTVALTQILKVFFLNWGYAGKATGIRISRLEDDFWAMSFTNSTCYVYVLLGLLLLFLLFSYNVQRSRLNLLFAAVRESPVAAEALGVHVPHIRRLAIAISGVMAGVVGAFYAQFTGFIDPDKVFGLTLNFEFLLPPVIGGRLSLVGPILGSAVLRPLKDILRGIFGGQADALYLIIYGLVLIVGILLMPLGIAELLRRFHARFLVGGKRS